MKSIRSHKETSCFHPLHCNWSFPSSQNSQFQKEAKCKTSGDNEFWMHENKKKSFSCEWLRTKPRFETEAWGNLEMTYWLKLIWITLLKGAVLLFISLKRFSRFSCNGFRAAVMRFPWTAIPSSKISTCFSQKVHKTHLNGPTSFTPLERVVNSRLSKCCF